MAFFEEIGKKLSDAGQSVAQSTKNLADVTQLNSANSDKEKKIHALYTKLGQAYYETYKNDPAAELKETVEEITALFAEIEENKEKIKQIKGIVKCAKCGADVPAGASFCNSCGSKVERGEGDKAELRCAACGGALNPGAAFCTHCGAKIGG